MISVSFFLFFFFFVVFLLVVVFLLEIHQQPEQLVLEQSRDQQLLVFPLPPPPTTFFQHVKAWFKYSETIFLARATMLSGFVIAAAGAMDWSPLFSLNVDTGFSRHQVIWLGATTFGKGCIDELARRRNSPVING